ncbi:uncharacterized protein LOC117049282 [Lacerta agilis]|uniref:uncharacterized protein LOC117049282 n=1 Tax=Lacerta agilis TaxID=80427 RepID=UPI00141950CC|nr:uncharacterized protein LOC117049282 [Lacerta agilis]
MGQCNGACWRAQTAGRSSRGLPEPAVQLRDSWPPGKSELSRSRDNPETPIMALHVVRVFTPSVILELYEKGSSLLCIKARFHLSGKFFFGKHFERIDIIVDVDLKAEVRFEDYFAAGVHIRMQVCKSEFIIARITCPSHLLVKKVRPVVTTILAASFQKTLCRVVEMVINVARVDFLYTANVFFSVGTVATMQYQLACLPLITSSHVTLEFDVRSMWDCKALHPGSLSSCREADLHTKHTQSRSAFHSEFT